MPARVSIGGYEHGCTECHRLFDSRAITAPRLVQHTHIKLNHGLNDKCFNCHDRFDRARLVLYDGTRIDFDQVPRLCAQCHGTLYRDWLQGTHGKTMGSWDAGSGSQVRLGGNDCHDPHAPAYPRLQPLPPPNTLRMGAQPAHHEADDRHRPLRRWSSAPGHAAAHQAEADDRAAGEDHP